VTGNGFRRKHCARAAGEYRDRCHRAMCAQAGHSFNATSPSMAAVTLPGVARIEIEACPKIA